MSELMVACPACSQVVASTVKFCGSCGAPIAFAGNALAVPNTGAQRFTAHITAVMQQGVSIGTLIESLLDDAEAFGVSKLEAMQIIESLAETGSAVPIRCWYDQQQADLGVAGGNTLLAVRVGNVSPRSLEVIDVTIVHPITQTAISLPPIGLLTKGSDKDVEADLHFDRIGRQSIRDGVVTIRQLTGEVTYFRFDTAVRVTAENSQAARTNIHSVSQTIQTHGGGVISADGLRGSDSAPAPIRWQEIRLVSCAGEVLEAFREASAAIAQSAAEETARALAAAQTPATPEAPGNLTAIPRPGGSIALHWVDHAFNEQGFYLERSTDGVSFVRFATTGPDTSSYIADGLTVGATYLFRIRAFNDAGCSPYSNTASAMTVPSPEASAPVTAASPAPVINIVTHVAAAPDAGRSHPPAAPLSDSAVKSKSIAKVALTVVIVVGLLFVALIAGVLSM